MDTANFNKLSSTVAKSFHDNETLIVAYEVECGGMPESHQPQQEMLTLLKICSEMDVVF